MVTEANISSTSYQDNFAVARDVFRPNDGMGVLIRSKIAHECGQPPWETPGHVITNTRTDFTHGTTEQNVVRRLGLRWKLIGK
jgi:hypothetical protein